METQIHKNSKQMNDYYSLILLMGDSVQLREYVDNFLKYHLYWRKVDLYGDQRHTLFHAQWVGQNIALLTLLTYEYTQIVDKLQKREMNKNEIHQFANEECARLVRNIKHMYLKDRELNKFGWNFGEVIRVLCENWQAGSLTYVDILMEHMHHPRWGEEITQQLIKINISKSTSTWQKSTTFRDLFFKLHILLKRNMQEYLDVNTNYWMHLNRIQLIVKMLGYDSHFRHSLHTALKYTKKIQSNSKLQYIATSTKNSLSIYEHFFGTIQNPSTYAECLTRSNNFIHQKLKKYGHIQKIIWVNKEYPPMLLYVKIYVHIIFQKIGSFVKCVYYSNKCRRVIPLICFIMIAVYLFFRCSSAKAGEKNPLYIPYTQHPIGTVGTVRQLRAARELNQISKRLQICHNMPKEDCLVLQNFSKHFQ